MKAQFIDKLLCASWHISQLRGRSLIGGMIKSLRVAPAAERPAESAFGDPLPKMQIVGDVAIVPIRGVLMINVPDWVKEWGINLTDANDIEEELQAAVANDAVQMIVLDVDSPGGWSIAGNKLFDVVEAAGKKKPLFAWCADGGDLCSAAYDAAAPARAIYSGRHPLAIGSIGSYLAFLDDTDYWAQLGFKWEIFRSGEFKGLGEDALSEDQRAFLQSTVDEYGAKIRKNVSKYRTAVAPEDMRGQWFSGPEASRRGFTQGTARDLSAAISAFRRLL